MKRVDAECRDADPGGVDPDPRDKKGSGFNLHESLDPERHAKMEPGFDQINKPFGVNIKRYFDQMKVNKY